MPEYSLEQTAGRLRQAMQTEPDWSDPSPGSWEKVAAAAGLPDQALLEPTAPTSTPTSRRGFLLGCLGLAVGAALGAAGTWAALRRRDPAPEMIRRAVLTPLDAPDSELGTARLLLTASGHVLEVEVPTGLENPTGYVEAWLINVDLQRMVSVGVFAAGTTSRFSLDEALITSGYLIVDLSNEDFDDEPRHSGDTIIRGELL